MPTAAKFLLSIDRSDARRIVEKIDQYASSQQPLRYAKKLEGHDAYRFRVGRYRVVFEYDHATIFVLVIDQRKDIYRR